MGLPDTVRRVAIIRELMADLRWSNAENERLQSEWGCCKRVVAQAAAEASRQLAAADDATHARRRVEVYLANAERAAELCEEQGNPHLAANIWLNAAKVIAKVAGLESVNVAVSAKSDADIDWSSVLEAARKPRPKAAQS